ncbi:DNA starvation/stationary phase protection protein [Peptoniphilus sp. oral taxon 386]|uniref:Dps family protein n=1 Tax=Peptoniphilus sp. oral taxon 386 TaxID=652713 RepID=UPI0001DA9B07|nr:DNA starvation/stationary phase protection protein [Peptoniphilus sp. oral taxon 386]EFI42081.1 putative DNA protection during starvation protein 2 [Peptoniphilus sp. oral taxon 386 str. F0131]
MKNLDKYLANLAVGNIKLHNLHWNVTGFTFKAVHEYLEALYDDFFEKYDAIAEYQKMNGVYPKASLKEYLEISDINELESKDIDAKSAVEEALKLLKHMRELAEVISDESDDFVLSNMMEDHITGYNKQIWFMESMLK